MSQLLPNLLSKIHPSLLLAIALIVCALPPIGAHAQTGNSSEIIRVKPNAIAKKIGTAVDWQPDLKTALALAKKSDKPIFWYVPTLPNTFMDRKIEVHRYMMAGPFSWPSIIETLNKNAICLKAIPSAQQQRQYGLERYKYVEPGFVVFDPAGTKVTQVDQLTTLHPVWLLSLIEHSLNVEPSRKLFPSSTQAVWELIADRQFAPAAKAAAELATANQADAETYLQAEFARGVSAFKLRQQNAARKIWTDASERFPEHPLAWKIAAEAQGFGPFVRGFETFTAIPESALRAGIDSRGSAAPKDTYSEAELHQRSIDFLLSMQNGDGGFYDSDYDFGGTDSLKNVHVAVTSLAGIALINYYDSLQSQTGSPESDRRLERTTRSLNAAIRFVSDDQNLNKNDRDEILWAYAFRLRFLLSSKAWQESTTPTTNSDASNKAHDQLIQKCISSLESIQTNRGSWYHEYNNPFVTANALVALQDAKSRGYQVNESKLAKGAANLMNDRFSDGSYPYGTSKRNNSQRPGGLKNTIASAGRMPLCELALFRLGKSDDAKLLHAVQTSFEHHATMAKAYKYDNHTDSYIYGGFFFWYDMRSRSEAILSIADKQKREQFRSRQKQLILDLPEVDGCFVDSHELGRVYGTAMALISLDLLDSKPPTPTKQKN
jgi:hypothetical protein